MSEKEKVLEPLWTVRKAAKYLSVYPGTIYNWISQGKILTIVRIGSTVRIPESEIVRLAGVVRRKLKQ